MKKFLFIFVCAPFLCLSSPSRANENSDGKDIIKNILISEEIQTETEADKAKDKAGQLLEQGQKKLEIKGLTKPAKRAVSKPQVKNFDKYGEGPFGLAWGSDNVYTKGTGVILKDLSNPENPRMYGTSYLPKPLADFERVNIYFGLENMLWRVVAYSKEVEDDAALSKTMKLYDKYARLLEKKYGGKKEVFEPKVIKIETTRKDDRGRDETIIEEKMSERGSNTFREEIKKGESVLYSTFSNGKIGVGLSLEVSEEDLGYIVIDYKNLQIIQEHEDKALEAI